MSLSRHFQISALGALAIGFALAMAPGCGSDDKPTDGTGGSTGGSGGSTGGSGGSTGGSGGATGGAGGGGAVTPAFMNIAPCSAESDYVKTDTIKATAVLKYSPACVQIKKGGSVKFDMMLDVHPLKKSAMRGNTTDNPIMDTNTGTSASFTFPKSGFFAFFCMLHGGTDTGTGMAGVVWVTD